MAITYRSPSTETGEIGTPSLQEPRPRKRHLRTYIICAVVIAVAVMLNVWLITGGGSSKTVLAVGKPVAKGTVIQASDLTAVQSAADPGLATIPSGDSSRIVGKRAATDLIPGTTLSMQSVADQLIPAQGEQLVGIELASGQLPAGELSIGDSVEVVTTPRGQDDPPVTAPATLTATIAGVEPRDNDKVVVNLAVAKEQGALLAAQAATGRVSLVMNSRER